MYSAHLALDGLDWLQDLDPHAVQVAPPGAGKTTARDPGSEQFVGKSEVCNPVLRLEGQASLPQQNCKILGPIRVGLRNPKKLRRVEPGLPFRRGGHVWVVLAQPETFGEFHCIHGFGKKRVGGSAKARVQVSEKRFCHKGGKLGPMVKVPFYCIVSDR